MISSGQQHIHITSIITKGLKLLGVIGFLTVFKKKGKIGTKTDIWKYRYNIGHVKEKVSKIDMEAYIVIKLNDIRILSYKTSSWDW